jgi:hypothetical protein
VRALVLGGTRFIGPPTVCWLIDSGHEVVLFHRSGAEPQECADAAHIHGDFATFAESLPKLIDVRPNVVLDTVPYIDKADGYAELVPVGEGLRRTVAWTRANPPTTERVDYSIEDRVLAAIAP